MRGQFIFPLLPSLNLECNARVQYTPQKDLVRKLNLPDNLDVDIKIYHEGELLKHLPNYAQIKIFDSIELSQSLFTEIAGSDKDALVHVTCSVASANQPYFPQEHQISYSQPEKGALVFLIYDQLPLQSPGRTPSPIVLIASKVWISSTTNTYIVFSNASNLQPQKKKMSVPLCIAALDLQGRILKEKNFYPYFNDTLIVDVKDFLKDVITISDSLQHISFVAKGGESTFAIFSLIECEKPYSLAIEHSLAPSYYSSGHIPNIRKGALSFVEGLR